MNKIDLYIVNLKERTDRRKHILRQFHDKPEFNVEIIDAIKHQRGAYGLWQTFRKTVSIQNIKKNPYFIFCEDDHLFTKEYYLAYLTDCIWEAERLNVDILSGGVSWFKAGIQISKNLFWVEASNGMQFTVIFKNAYETILSTKASETIITDMYLSKIFSRKMVMYPFISIQKEFGYSDVTETNKEDGRVKALFKETSEWLQLLKNVRQFYLPDFKR